MIFSVAASGGADLAGLARLAGKSWAVVMKISGRRAARILSACAASAMLLATLAAPAPVPSNKPVPTIGETPTAAKQETRLRKLHLVRPDLIPYPIAFEVYC